MMKIRNANKLGYQEAHEGDGIDLQFPSSVTRRGRVQRQMIHTLDCSGGATKGVIVEDKYYYSKKFKKTLLDYDNKVNDTWKPSVYKASYNRDVAYTLTCRGCEGYQRGSQVNAIVEGKKNNCSVGYLHDKYDTEEKISNLRIRKLTPKECWRLMAFEDSDFEKAEKVNSDTQLYKQAGNSIVVDCLVYIFKDLLSDWIGEK